MKFNPVWLALAACACYAQASAQEPRSTGVLGKDDQIVLRSVHVAELNEKTVRVDSSGMIDLPMVGRIQASGLAPDQLEHAIEDRLRNVYNDPDVSIQITEHRSQPISVLGAVNKPGVYQLEGRKTLLEILSVAGGVAPEAGYSVRIMRGAAWGSLPEVCQPRREGDYWVGKLNLAELTGGMHPAANIAIFPDDVITVPRGMMVYVMGEVQKAGGFVLREDESVSVLQAIAMASGLSKMASPQKARILRPNSAGGERQEIAVNLKPILDGRAPDMRLFPDDILLIPNNVPKAASLRALEVAVQMGTGIVIWSR